MFGYGGYGGCGYGGVGFGGCGFGGGFALIVVLFILLIIVGASCFSFC
ncbi:YjcZ family sporulation protein [Bacillus sp. FJAT-29790]|nr:YjcZ family sporulation protein [Bacillus sp. FJAT-29790]MBU8877551.1 YjcZ family sporulation protein [Bacillus sp. FJAT-29790]